VGAPTLGFVFIKKTVPAVSEPVESRGFALADRTFLPRLEPVTRPQQQRVGGR
jgi:hypothetical protein